MDKRKRSVLLFLILICLFSSFHPQPGFCQEDAGDSSAYQKARRFASRLSPEEKVGQLFLVTFDGVDISEQSEIYHLIADYHIGGVILKGENANFGLSAENTSTSIKPAELQSLNWELSNDTSASLTSDFSKNYTPLFIGISQSGGSYPYDQLISGITNVPSQMAVGATWNLESAKKMGELAGRQLEYNGFNLLLGPSVDVLDVAYNRDKENLGVRTYGGDPFWVGEMGAAYINGLHEGSGNRLTVIARNFPGRGSSDRLPEEEIATVRKSLEQLKLIELAPFFRITDLENENAEAAEITDGLLNSHIRYQGFQGNIRATTKPITFDQNAVDLLMELSPLVAWRAEEGLLVSDDLGSQAVYEFYDPAGDFIDARQVARNAFLAGNDLLYIDQLISTGDEDRFTTYRKTIELFVQKYQEDQAFAERVDESLVRILKEKFDLYKDFSFEQVLLEWSNQYSPEDASEIIFEVAKQAATLLSPDQSQVNETIPAPPQYNERIIIFTDNQTTKQCAECVNLDIFPVDGLQSSISELYGRTGSGQINENRIISYSFEDLNDFVFNPFNRPELQENLSNADWVLFALREIPSNSESSYALHNLLEENATVLRDKNVFVFSFDVPYYFDATDISAFSAYYGLYCKLPEFVDVAARIVFQELIPQGASPVSISGTAYDLPIIMTPKPDQIIPLAVDEEAAQLITDEGASPAVDDEEETSPIFKLGDNLPVKTGLILDHNAHPVPDGTVVRFTMHEQGSNSTIQQVESVTNGGIAQAVFLLQKPGFHEIKVISEPAKSSQILVLDISEEETVVSAIIPTPAPLKEATPVVEVPFVDVPKEDFQKPNDKFTEWGVGTTISWIFGLILFIVLKNYFVFEDRTKISGFSVAGGLFNSAWLIFNLPGSPLRIGFDGYFRFCFSVLVGTIIGAVIGWIMARVMRYNSENQ